MNKELWLQFENKEAFLKEERFIHTFFSKAQTGDYDLLIHLRESGLVKRVNQNGKINISEEIVELLMEKFGKSNVKIVFREAPKKEPIIRVAESLERIADSLEALTECTFTVKPMYENSIPYRIFRTSGTFEVTNIN